MSEKKAEQTIAVAKKCLKRGIYAVSKDSYCELKKENYRSNEDLRKAVENYQKQFSPVYVQFFPGKSIGVISLYLHSNTR